MSPTSEDSVTWRVTFSEDVVNVTDGDFTVTGTGAGVVTRTVTRHSDSEWDVEASGGNLAELNETITLGFAGDQDIADEAGNALSTDGTPDPNDNTFELENGVPTVTKYRTPRSGGLADQREFRDLAGDLQRESGQRERRRLHRNRDGGRRPDGRRFRRARTRSGT